GYDSAPDALPLPRRRGGVTLGGILGDRPQPRRPAQSRATAAQLGSIALTSWPDRLRSRGGSRPRAENEAAFCTDRPAVDTGQPGDRPWLSGGGVLVFLVASRARPCRSAVQPTAAARTQSRRLMV